MIRTLALAFAALLHLRSPTATLTETARLVASTTTARSLVPLVAAVCFIESRAGEDRNARSLCGTRLHGEYIADGRQSVEVAARSLGRWMRRSGTMRGALIAYRYNGNCRDRDPDGYARRVTRVRGAIAGRLRRR